VTAVVVHGRRLAVRVAPLLVVAGGLLVPAAMHLAALGRAELAACDRALSQNDVMSAAVHARQAARAYVPGALFTVRAYGRLREIAEMSERKGDIEAALFAWRAMLSAAAGVRPFAPSCDDACQGAEASVARLTAALVRASARTTPASRRVVSAENPAEAPIGLPGPVSSALVVAGAVLTWGAGLRLARLVEGRRGPGTLRAAAGLALAGVVVWVAGLFLG
jgi:hypothetical protein